jgi:hypothetical protein
MKKSILVKFSFALVVYAGFSPALWNLKRVGSVNKNSVDSLTQADPSKSFEKQPEHQVQLIYLKKSTNLDWRDDVTSVIHNIEPSIHQNNYHDKHDTIKKNNVQKKYAYSAVTDNAISNLPLESSFYSAENEPYGQDEYNYYQPTCTAPIYKPVWKFAFFLPMIFAY